MNKPIIYWIDLFSGAGGTSTGIHLAEANAGVVACVNHDAAAIASHLENHPDCLHFVEDIRDFAVVVKLKKLVKFLKEREPNCIINIWASLECTNYSKAKGGLPRDADSRTLAWDLLMYVEHLKPDYLYIENVSEFMAWGPLDDGGRPISSLCGIDYTKWVNTVKEYGFDYDFRVLNAADFGATQVRKRYFGIFACNKPIEFPTPTHYDPRKFRRKDGMFEFNKIKWRGVKEVLQLEDKGRSIFTRKKELVDNTLERVYAGLRKFVVHSSFMTEYYGNGMPQSVDRPCPTVPTKDRFALHHILYDYSTFTSSPLDRPAGTLTTVPKHNLVTHEWLTDTQYGRVGQKITRPSFTLIARMDKKPPYYLAASQGVPSVKFSEDDSLIMFKIKHFMRVHGIADIKMRMLNILELKRIQGFPDDYILRGTMTDQKKQIGNAVEVHQATALINANYNALSA